MQQAVAEGKQVKRRPECAERTARELELRLERRTAVLEREEALQSQPPVVVGEALIVPQGLLDRLAGLRDLPAASYVKDTATVERRAVDTVLAAERALGRQPTEMPHNNPGFDVLSVSPEGGPTIELEVKGRIAGSDDFFVTRTEVLPAKNIGDRYRLTLVAVHPEGPDRDEVRYVENPFVGFDFAAYGTTGKWHEMWARGRPPW